MKNETYDEYNIDEFPLGMNAVVAVISYTVSRLKNRLNFTICLN